MTNSTRRAAGLAAAFAAPLLAALVGCQPAGPVPDAAGAPSGGPSTSAGPDGSAGINGRPKPATSGQPSGQPSGLPSGKPPVSAPPAADTGPHIVYFRITQQPKCPEGTAVYRAE